MDELRDLHDAGWSFEPAFEEVFGGDERRYEEAREAWVSWEIEED